METLDKNQLWQIVLGDLELSISKANFKTWLQNTRISQIEDNGETVIVSVPNTFTQTWLERKYHRDILKSLQGATDDKVKKVIYRVETSQSIKPSQPLAIELEELKEISTQKESETKNETNSHGLNPKYTFETFIVGSGNELANAASLAAAGQPGKKYNPLFIYGGVGLGKTHLLQAIGHVILKKNPKVKFLYTNAEKFTNEFIQAVGNGSMDKFRKNYRNLDILLIDDFQFMAGKERTQEEFFHTFNTLYQDGRQIVITSDRPPKAIPALEDRLTSRLEWGLIADINPPDLETRLAILKAKCQEKKYGLSEDVLQYLAAQIQSNIRELEGALNKIMAYHELHKIELDLPTVKNILVSLTTQPKKSFLQPKQIIEAVANFYGIRVDEVTGDSRKRELVVPRQISMFLMREEIDASFPLIGKALGNRDHTTAMHAYSKIKQSVAEGGRVKQEIDLIKQRLYN
ncbi:MAG: chromosomal replication initiator protein DnaA [Patescibacteria group bacterium]|nr:chromosomal replication initiator protein DnaA [Patescibacteria group bacterium]MDD5164596.1 chromosomal replication initiator protein DnaA [Patescibacteria group bacterium]MDD5534351.1 chromosomal replication initiator protein DnaA [Patescibacteria group bacterium]